MLPADELAARLAAYDAAPDPAVYLWALPAPEAEALARALARRHVGRPPILGRPCPPPPPRVDAEGAAQLLAAVVTVARRDAAQGSREARGWLEAWVDGPGRDLAARRPARVRRAA